MAYAAEAQIARELHKFAANGLLYRGSKPVLWSVVEKTALAEAEVEYDEFVSDQVWVKFPARVVATDGAPADARHAAWNRLVMAHCPSVALWPTTTLDIPGNRAICLPHKPEERRVG